MSTRLNVILLIALVCSSLYLIKISYESRSLVTRLDRARTEADRLSTELSRLKTERQAQATPLRVEKTARSTLRMKTASPAITQYVSLPAAAVASAPTAGGRP